MRNYKELSEEEVGRLERLYPDTGDIRWPADSELRPARGDASLKCEVHKSWNQQLRRKVEFDLTDDDSHVFRDRR